MPKGLKRVRKRLADGSVRLYWYHRATGQRLKHPPETAEGHLEVAGLDRASEALAPVLGHLRGSYAHLWSRYRESPEWIALKPRTRSDYQAVRDWIGDGAGRVLVMAMTTVSIMDLRDKAARQKGRRFANYVVQVLRLTLEWGRRRSMLKDNPARSVELIRKPKSEAKVNRAWTDAEVEAFARAAPPHLVVPFALGLFAGFRQGDALTVTWRAYDGVSIRWTASKNAEACRAPVTGAFKAILDRAKLARGRAVQIAVNSHGAPWTASGFRASFFKLLRDLKAAGAIEPGCTFHGLRHTIGKGARDGGESDSRIAAAIGDRTPAMASIYAADADRAGAQMAVLEAGQKRLANIEWKPERKPFPKGGR